MNDMNEGPNIGREGTGKSIAGLVQKPMVIAHRGFSGEAPENTFAAFKKALDIGVDMIELDVQLSRDGHVVVIHDDKVDRTTDGKGKVSVKTLDELKNLDAGTWFSDMYAGERIPTLREALELITPDAYVNIEIKTNTVIRKADTEIADRTLGLVEEMNLLDRVLFSSFNHKLVGYVKKKNQRVHTGVIFHPLKHAGRLPSSLTRVAGAEVFVCGRRDVTRRRIADARKHNIVIGVYGIETRDEIHRLLDEGIRVLVSDYPDRLVQALHDYSTKTAS
jgi:glycerophosphoryl diester phosphodiesterase